MRALAHQPAAIMNRMTARAETSSAVPRFDGVDVLRGLSILAVVVPHTWLRFLYRDASRNRFWPNRPVSCVDFGRDPPLQFRFESREM